MTTKHTPGPWVLDDLAHSHVVDADYHVIESGKGYHLDGEESDGFNVTGCISLDDASLIAAAPDLLAALERALSWLTSYPAEAAMGPDGPYSQAVKAIAKAKGEA